MSNAHSPGLNAERPTRQRTSGAHIARDVLYPITWLFATVTWIVAAVNISHTERVGGYYYNTLVELLVAGLLTSMFTIPLFIIFRRPTTNAAVLKMRWAEIVLLSIFAALFLGGTATLTRRRRSIFWFCPTTLICRTSTATEAWGYITLITLLALIILLIVLACRRPRSEEQTETRETKRMRETSGVGGPQMAATSTPAETVPPAQTV